VYYSTLFQEIVWVSPNHPKHLKQFNKKTIMSNMSYCRFENTARDLQDCLDAIQDGEINDLGSQYEVDALEELLDLCKEVVAYKDEIEDAVYNKNLEFTEN